MVRLTCKTASSELVDGAGADREALSDLWRANGMGSFVAFQRLSSREQGSCAESRNRADGGGATLSGQQS